jgi:hypothetical protein
MAIKITKPGQKEFHGFCKWCGCEFTYEISDLKLSATSDKVSCPTCGKDYRHPTMVQDPTTPGGIGRLQDISWPTVGEPIPCAEIIQDPCDQCTWRKNLLENGSYVGDTPCTWCPHNKFSCTVSTAISSVETCPEARYLKACTTSASELEADREYVAQKLQEVCGAKAEAITQGTVMSMLNTCNSTNKCGDTECRNSCSGEHKCGGKKNCKSQH